VTGERDVEPLQGRDLILRYPGDLRRFVKEGCEVVVVDEAADGFCARIDLGPLAPDEDALLIALVREIARGLENAPELGFAIHHGFIP
jgi:hypothetical protein